MATVGDTIDTIWLAFLIMLGQETFHHNIGGFNLHTQGQLLCDFLSSTPVSACRFKMTFYWL